MKVEPIPSCEGYYAGEDGNITVSVTSIASIWSEKKLKPLKPHNNGGPYLGVTICIHSKRRYRKIHRLVFEAFHGPCDGLEIHHVDGDPTNNTPENLSGLSAEAHYEEHTAVENAIRFLTRVGYTVTKG